MIGFMVKYIKRIEGVIMYKIVLASKSPRRVQLLKDYGIEATPIPANIKENHPINCDYISTVMYLAFKKATGLSPSGYKKE
jgi:predicted house-cleaning NTP pyrophosphatase (Maf/HAM1 superfamily)